MRLCGFEAGLSRPFFLIAGPCVIESEQLQMDVAGRLKEITSALGIPFIFKSSYDKANRSSGATFRGPGMDKGLEILAKVRRELGVPVLTDVHIEADIAQVAASVDVLQTPAFLCRQTDFIRAVAQCGKPVNIKKGQFLAPHDMKNVPVLARAAIAVGVAGIFMETHPDPAHAMSDGPNAVPLRHMQALLEQLLALDRVVKQQPLLEHDFDC